MAKRWKKAEITYLKRYAAKRRVQELAERFRTNTDAVRAKLDELDLEAVDHRKIEAEPDPALVPLEKGVKALHAKKYAQAEKLLAKAAADAVRSGVANQARRYLAMARKQQKKQKKATADPYLQAVFERNRGNLEAALEICSRGGRQSKDDRFAHLAASIYATLGETEKAAKFLEVAIQLDPRNRVIAYHDSDFEALRDDPEYAELFSAE